MVIMAVVKNEAGKRGNAVLCLLAKEDPFKKLVLKIYRRWVPSKESIYHLFLEIKFYWNTVAVIHLLTVYGCIHATLVAEYTCDGDLMATGPEYLLSGFWWKNFADSWTDSYY